MEVGQGWKQGKDGGLTLVLLAVFLADGGSQGESEEGKVKDPHFQTQGFLGGLVDASR